MTLWIILTLMTSAAAVLVAAPFLRRFDARRANAAIAEIKRKPFAVEPAPTSVAAPFSFGEHKLGAIAVTAVVVLGSGLYAFNGGPELPHAAGAQRAVGVGETSVVDQLAAASSQMPAEPLRATPRLSAAEVLPPDSSPRPLASVDEMIERLAERLKRNANDPEGWRTLGWSYLRTERFAEAAEAYAKAVELSPAVASTRSAWGEALVKAAGGVVTPESKAVFEQTLGLDPKDSAARYFMGLAKAQAGDKRAALDAWLALFDETDAKEPWIADITESITETAQEIGVDVSARLSRSTHAATDSAASPPALPPAPQGTDGPGNEPPVAQARDASGRNPSEEDIKNAQNMSPDERTAMIRRMVEGLASRLEQSPRDVDGWIKLIRSRSVLGETDIARRELGKALNVFSDTPQDQTRIEAVARQLGVTR